MEFEISRFCIESCAVIKVRKNKKVVKRFELEKSRKVSVAAGEGRGERLGLKILPAPCKNHHCNHHGVIMVRCVHGHLAHCKNHHCNHQGDRSERLDDRARLNTAGQQSCLACFIFQSDGGFFLLSKWFFSWSTILSPSIFPSTDHFLAGVRGLE